MNLARASELAAPMVASDLTLRPLTLADEPALTAAFAEEELWTWMLVEQPRGRAGTLAWIDAALDAAERGLRVPFVAVRPDETIAGTSSFLTIREADRSVEIGWTMFFAGARNGWINGRAKGLMLERAFSVGFCRVELKTDARNARSRAAIAAIGATFEGVLRSYQRRADGTQRDSAMFSVTADEWPGVRSKLEHRTGARKGER